MQVGFTKDGKITAVECDIYNNAGHSLDLSAAVSTIHFLLFSKSNSASFCYEVSDVLRINISDHSNA